MAYFKIITNNPMVSEKYPSFTEFYDFTVEGVFVLCRDEVHKGASLISHPLSGSIKPNINPYKSVVVSACASKTDFASLQLIETALVTLKKLGERIVSYNDSIISDFQAIDLDLLDSAVSAIPPRDARL